MKELALDDEMGYADSSATGAHEGAKMTLTPNADQKNALLAIKEWYEARTGEPFVLGGLAGTGKTAMLPMLHDELGFRSRYVCPTWKAANVLTKKLKAAGIFTAATSIHNLIYNPRGILHEEGCGIWENPAGGCTKNPKCKQLTWQYDPKEMPQLLVVDEASMVDQKVRADIEALGCPVLYVGDHGQLPPVNGTNVFEDRKPNILLESIQRQAAGSPIIELSRIVRDGDPKWLLKAEELGFPVLQTGTQSQRRYDPREAVPPHSDPNTVYIAATNAGVDKLNAHTRRILGRGPELLVPGELVMAQNNTRKSGIFNGQQGVISEVIDSETRYVSLTMETGVSYEGPVFMKGADEVPDANRDTPVFRHSYAVTCHKAQGSEFDNVVVYLVNSRPETRQWLYTAVTRAKSKLTIVKAY
jgi:exodeoxyribonuclease-5